MKTKKSFFILTTIALFAFSISSYSQDPETHYIVLNVDTSIINSQNADDVSNFGQEQGISNRDYTIEARIGDIIVWQGLSSVSDSDDVSIVSINYEGGTNIFNQNRLRGNDAYPERVIGTIVNGNVGESIKYKISFIVYNNGVKRQGTFHIDPKIILKK